MKHGDFSGKLEELALAEEWDSSAGWHHHGGLAKTAASQMGVIQSLMRGERQC